ncbi:TPA: protease modulator HflC [Vibrio parahaemolyticus]
MKKLNYVLGLTLWFVLILIVGFTMFTDVIPNHKKGLKRQWTSIEKLENGQFKIYEPGRYFTIPMYESFEMIDVREFPLSVEDMFVTKLKKNLVVDYFVPWRVVDFEKYYLATRNDLALAQDRLNKKVREAIQSEIGEHTILEVSTGAIVHYEQEDKSLNVKRELTNPRKHVEQIVGKREEVLKNAYLRIKNQVYKDFGLEAKSVEFANLSLPSEASQSVFKRMNAERKAVADKFRSEGRMRADEMMSLTDKRVDAILSEANKEAIKTRRSADAEVAEIYSSAIGAAPEFYEFYLAMETIKKSFNPDDVLMLDTNSHLLKHMKGIDE